MGEASPLAELCAQVLELLDRFDAYVADPGRPPAKLSELALITMALTLIRTPAARLPELRREPVPERAGIRA